MPVNLHDDKPSLRLHQALPASQDPTAQPQQPQHGGSSGQQPELPVDLAHPGISAAARASLLAGVHPLTGLLLRPTEPVVPAQVTS